MNKFTLILCFLPALAWGAVSFNPAPECSDAKTSLHKAFVPTDFEDRTTVGRDQVEPLRALILGFISANPSMVITDIEVTASSAKAPFYIQSGKRKILDPQSLMRNSNLARERSDFAQALLREIKMSKSELSNTVLVTKSEVAGPDFVPLDLNSRFVTPMTAGYADMVRSHFEEHKAILGSLALKTSADELLNESIYPNFYQVKFKPFQGLRLEILGHAKCENGKSKSVPGVIRQ